MGIKAKIVLKNLSNDELKRLFDKVKILDHEESYRFFICDAKKIRSNSQNRYYWGVVIDEISQTTGIPPEDLHEILKQKFNLKTQYIGGNVYEFGGQTKILNTKEFTDYLEKIRIWAAVELDCHIPSPGELPDETIIEMMNQGY